MYTVLSARVGIVGEPFNPPDGCNIEALLNGGFIGKKDNKTSTKSVKVNNSQQVPDDLTIDTE